MTSGPPPAPQRRPPLVSPLVLATADASSPDAANAMVADDEDRRLLLVELRVRAGDDPESVRERFIELFDRVFRSGDRPPRPVPIGRHYMRCALTPDQVIRLVQGGAKSADAKAALRALEIIYHVWPDLVVDAHLDRSLTTIKADAASRTYSCGGAGVVWGILDSGIDRNHPHFAEYNTLAGDSVKHLHRDFTLPATPGPPPDPLRDLVGHGTHVAGIVAGCSPSDARRLRIASNEPTVEGFPRWSGRTLPKGTSLGGVAPQAHLVSLKVLDDNAKTVSSVVIEALDYVRTINGQGRSLQIHGVNLSLGCGWLPEEYGAGQSPLCKELDLLVGTGVVAVVSAGNSGAAGTTKLVSSDVYGQLSTITDPGNSATAITVGSVHRYRPHTYGVTFTSSKGPTIDGRLKPDLVAPGERITSAATGAFATGVPPLTAERGERQNLARYVEHSGTSMAAAHVSGMIAAFLSAREEFIGQPQLVKQLLMDTASDLGRHQFFQGAGLIDLMRALSST